MTSMRISQSSFFKSAYFFLFFGFGALYPLLSVFFRELGMNGNQIGILTSIGPVVAILTQPLWGMVIDRFQIEKAVLLAALGLNAAIAVCFPQLQTFAATFLFMVLLHLFQAPVVPVLDHSALNHAQRAQISYGSLRLWGAAGFAIAGYASGLLAERSGPSIIFYLFSVAGILALLSVLPIPSPKARVSFQLGAELKQLMKTSHFLLFLFSAFFIFGPMNANNVYFGIYFQEIGGTLSGIGLVFLLAAGSEAPMMRVASSLIRKMGLENTLLLAASVSMLRWLFFATVHHPLLITALFFLQGISIGLFLTAAPQYVKTHTPRNVQVTALTLYSAFGNGIGTMFSNLTAGWLYDRYSIFVTYLFFAFLTFLGVVAVLLIKRVNAGSSRAEA